ncbi:MAG: hypothetical protein ACN6OP_00450 [Pseudomonadales bacterium]
MPIKIHKPFQWSPNGYDIATVEAGDYETLPERAAQIAVQLGATEEVEGMPSTSAPSGAATGLAAAASGQEAGQANSPAVEDQGQAAPQGKNSRRRSRAAEATNG